LEKKILNRSFQLENLARGTEEYVEIQAELKELKAELKELKAELKEVEVQLKEANAQLEKAQKSKILLISQLDPWPLRVKLNIDSLTNEGVPFTFRTNRQNLIDNIKSRLLGIIKPSFPVIFIRSPPYSGKTGLCQLLCDALQQDPNMSVVFIRGYVDTKVKNVFFQKIGSTLQEFLEHEGPRTLILDECQCTYTDLEFWQEVIKEKVGNKFSKLIIILAGSYGSLDVAAPSRIGTPIAIPSQLTMGLYESHHLPSLRLSREEFNEMVNGSPIAVIADEVWDFCDAHIGVASAVLLKLHDRTKSKQISVTKQNLLSHLYSNEMFDMWNTHRGFPTIKNLEKVSSAEAIPTEELKTIMRQVTSGCVIRFFNQPNQAAEILVNYGFLFPNQSGILCFASNLHMSVWLHSYNRDPMVHLIENEDFEQFIVTGISRMSANRLSQMRRVNNSYLRERQLHMIFAEAILSLLPADVTMVVEWRTVDSETNQRGYVDIIIHISEGKNWFLELLVDGVQAEEHLARFLPQGKYYNCLSPGCKYKLIDFRQERNVRKIRDHFMHVQFSEDFKKAEIIAVGSNCIVELSNY
jgi:hypothetical protein